MEKKMEATIMGDIGFGFKAWDLGFWGLGFEV